MHTTNINIKIDELMDTIEKILYDVIPSNIVKHELDRILAEQFDSVLNLQLFNELW